MHELPELPDVPSLAAFAPCVGQAFRLEVETGEALELELIEAEALPAHEGAPRQEPFCLVFRGPAGCNLPQSMYTLTHGQLGAVPVFLVPIGVKEGCFLLEAVFN